MLGPILFSHQNVVLRFGEEGDDILLKFSSIVFVKYHVWFLFAEHFDQIELMFVQHNTGPANISSE